MKKRAPHAFALMALGVFSTCIVSARPAQAYPIDCAILLCLAGGFPTSAVCSAAEAEFIRRITPWPIEPPLQIWNCPMGIAYRPDNAPLKTQDLFKVGFQPQRRLPSVPDAPLFLEAVLDSTDPRALSKLIDATPGADIDISGSAFNYIRAIHVYDLEWSSRPTRNGCNSYGSRMNKGSYGTQGQYFWNRISIQSFPDWMTARLSRMAECPYQGYVRAVGVEWSDVGGNMSHRIVYY